MKSILEFFKTGLGFFVALSCLIGIVIFFDILSESWKSFLERRLWLAYSVGIYFWGFLIYNLWKDRKNWRF